MDDGHHRDASIPVTAVSSCSGVSTRLSTPAVGSNILTCPLPSGSDSFESGILSQLGIPTHLADRSDHGLRIAYEKYKAYLEACRVYQEKVVDGSWTGHKLSGTDLIQLFVSRSFWHSHYKPLFTKVSNHSDMLKWLESAEDRLSDEALWGYKKASYQLKDLKAYLEQNEKKKGKGREKVKDVRSEGGSKKKKVGKKQVY